MEVSQVGDFLKKNARTPLRAGYLVCGVRLSIETNSDSILQIAQSAFELAPSDPKSYEEIRLRLWVEEELPASDRIKSKPYFRGLGNLVFSGFDPRSSLLINLRNRCGVGRFTPELALDARFWRRVLYPSLLAIVGPSAGLTLLHCACVAWKGSGLLLAGESGSGKSTLSLALAQAGFDFLSDDRTLIGGKDGSFRAWGLSPEMKQRADAHAHFPALANAATSELSKEQPVFRFDPVEIFGINRVQNCKPRWLVFLERQSEPGFSLSEIAPEDAALRLRKDLHQENVTAADQQRRTIDTLSKRGCYRLSYGGDPHVAARALRDLIAGGWNPRETISAAEPMQSVRAETAPIDPLRRFRTTSLGFDRLLMGRCIRIEADSPVILNHTAEAFSRFKPAVNIAPQFRWRIVCEPREGIPGSWPPLTAFCDQSLRYISLGQHGFIAVDLEAREAVGVLPESLAMNQVGFSSVFLSSLLYLSSPALGLTPVSAACVSEGEKGLLLFGTPNSGKTTSSYWAARKLGLEFHADQTVFMEVISGTLRGWGEFWPAAFRPETASFLPELAALARPFHYRDRTFLCVDKSPSFYGPARSSIPAACIFLERQSESTPRLIPLSAEDVTARSAMTTPFKDDAGSSEAREAVFQVLQRLPSYRLLYGDDPGMAATLFLRVLNSSRQIEVQV